VRWYVDRRGDAEAVGMRVALDYEASRGATTADISHGRTVELQEALKELGCMDLPMPPSADLLSRLDGELRGIEVKARGTSGPLTVLERELDTFRCAGSSGWLYVCWNATQATGQQLWLVARPAALPWIEVRPASRSKGEVRGTRHEAQYEVPSTAVADAGARVV